MNADTAALENASNTSRVHQLLPDGTPVKLELQDQLKGNKVELGQEVRYLVAEDVKDASGRVLIAKGAQAGGEVLDCKKAKKFGKSSELTFSASWVEASDGSRLPLNFRFTKEARNKGLIRFNSFLNPFGKGGDAKVKKGTQFTALVGQAPPELPTVTSADTKQVKTASDSPVETARPNSSNPSVSPASQR